MSKKDHVNAFADADQLAVNLDKLHSVSGAFDFYKPHEQYGMSNFPPSLARQEFADECDINTIMQRYDNGEAITHVARSEPLFLDYSSVPNNLADAMDFMMGANAEFMRLPANVRRTFDNDPAKFVDFAEDPRNLDQLRLWDLAPKPPEPPTPVSAAPASPASPSSPPASPGAGTQ